MIGSSLQKIHATSCWAAKLSPGVPDAAVWRALYPVVPEVMGQRLQLTSWLCDFFKATGRPALEVGRMGRRQRLRTEASQHPPHLLLLPGDAQTSGVGQQPHTFPVES